MTQSPYIGASSSESCYITSKLEQLGSVSYSVPKGASLPKSEYSSSVAIVSYSEYTSSAAKVWYSEYSSYVASIVSNSEEYSFYAIFSNSEG